MDSSAKNEEVQTETSVLLRLIMFATWAIGCLFGAMALTYAGCLLVLTGAWIMHLLPAGGPILTAQDLISLVGEWIKVMTILASGWGVAKVVLTCIHHVTVKNAGKAE